MLKWVDSSPTKKAIEHLLTPLLLNREYLFNEEMLMKILCLVHADFEMPGVVEDWARARGHEFIIKKPYKGESLPNAESFDFLIVMGGPQSVINCDEFPYLIQEIDLIKEAIKLNKKVFGFCLGAQLLGAALGAKTERSPHKEVGIYPIMLNQAGFEDPLLQGLSPSLPVIHWHNDMPGLTPSAVVLATSEGCPRQIIRYTPLAYGFQCHLEITKEGIETMIHAVPEDLAPSRFTMNEEELLAQDYASINDLMFTLLDRFERL